MLATKRFHYFECKNYARSLELDAVAKVMVVAVSDQPLSVHVVSRTPLQPQIRKYAARLFSFDGSENPIFRNVEFRHWQTGSILDKDEEREYNVAISTGPGVTSYGVNEVHWWLSECSAFSEAQLASSEKSSYVAPPLLHVRHGILLTLKLESIDASSAEISLNGLPEGSWRHVVLPEESGSGHYVIDTALLSPAEDYPLQLKLISKEVDRRIPLVYLHVSGEANYLPDLRPDDGIDMVAKLGHTGVVRLVLVEGEAGVGKTHTIEKVAEELRANAGFDVLRVTVPEEPDDELMSSLIRNCLMPAIDKSSFQEVVQKIEAALLLQETGGSLMTDFRLLARTASRMGPRLIVLRDCHLVTPKLADELWALISVLDDASWGGIRLAIEYRQPDGNANDALQSLLHKIRRNIRKVVLERKILPLGRIEFHRFAKRAFVHITDELSHCLFNRTGGFPLFLETYLRRLENLDLIRHHEGRWEISQPARVLADSLPEGHQVILEDLVRAGLRNTFASDWQQPAMVLGLIATADNAYAQALIRRALGSSAHESHVFHAMLKAAGIGSALDDGQIIFRHDLLREAVAAVAAAAEGFEPRARQVADALFACSPPSDEVKVRAIRVKIFALLDDDISCELELRNALKAAQESHDYGRIVVFLNHLLPLLADRSNIHERLLLMKELAWANWVSDSLLVARDCYLMLAAEAESNAEGAFSFSDAIATDAYRRAIGLDLELMEPRAFLKNTIAVLGRRQDHVSFNSILNRLVLFCARFGFPEYGFKFAELSFAYIGDGNRENEGSVLSSELGMLHASASPDTALHLFLQAERMAVGRPEETGTELAVCVHECLYHGRVLDIEQFDALWSECSEHRLVEPLARASLLRGSLLLREGNLKSAMHWIERTATMVQLYHMKQFELAVFNDQVIHALLSGDAVNAANAFSKLVLEFERVRAESADNAILVEKAFHAAERAASSLHFELSTITRPGAAPAFCDPAVEQRSNIAKFASLLGLSEIEQTYGAALQADPGPAISSHRLVDVCGIQLVLGAY